MRQVTPPQNRRHLLEFIAGTLTILAVVVLPTCALRRLISATHTTYTRKIRNRGGESYMQIKHTRSLINVRLIISNRGLDKVINVERMW